LTPVSIAFSATVSASPIAVAPSGNWASMMRSTAAWSFVGVCTASGAVENATTPTRTCFGSCFRKVRAAAWAALRRLGNTSSASIEREWSVTSMIVARSIGTATVRCGFASVKTSAASAASMKATGT